MAPEPVDCFTFPGTWHLPSRSHRGARGGAESEQIVGFVFHTIVLLLSPEPARVAVLCSLYLGRLTAPIKQFPLQKALGER